MMCREGVERQSQFIRGVESWKGEHGKDTPVEHALSLRV